MKWVRRRAHRATAAVTFIVAKRSEGEGGVHAVGKQGGRGPARQVGATWLAADGAQRVQAGGSERHAAQVGVTREGDKGLMCGPRSSLNEFQNISNAFQACSNLI
jgi:hypothetical protein